jgi:glycerol kinase
MEHFLALDQSTSATKAVVFDEEGRIVDREARGHRQIYPQPGWVEHDAEEIWTNTLAVLGATEGRLRERGGKIVSLSVTNQRETIVVFERGSGRPLHPAIVWQCRRGAEYCSAHDAAGEAGRVRERTGLKLDPYFSASKLQWLVRRHPDLRARLADGSALVGTIDTYLVYRLTGGRVFATDSTNASRTLLFDHRRLRWDDGLCELWEVPRRALAEVRESFDTFGETTLEGAWPSPVTIRGVMGDSQAALFAQRCFSPGAAKVTFGTGSSLLLNIGSAPRAAAEGLLTALAWSRGGVPTYALEGIIVSAASTLTWLRDQLGLAPDVAGLERLARQVEDSGGVHLVPAFSGLGLPYWRPEARAAILGLSGHSDARHVARAAFESIAFQVRAALDAMRAGAGIPVAFIAADGGPTASDFLMQLTADLTGTEIRVPAVPECSPLGAVLAAHVGSGRRSLAELEAIPIAARSFLPGLAPERARELNAGWGAAVSLLIGPVAVGR